MTAIDVNTQALDALAHGDRVSVTEAAKAAAYALSEAIDAQAHQTSPEQVFETLSEPAEALLAVLFPIIEYGDERALESIPRILLHVGSRTSAALEEPRAHRVGAVVVLGRVVWAAVAYAIHCGRFGALAQAGRATVRVPFRNDDVAPLIALTALRYPDALDGNASLAYENYHGWLEDRQLVRERYPLLRAELDDVFAEADLLLAILLAQHRGGVYSVGHDHRTVPRLARRLRDRTNRPLLAELFDTTESDLDSVLENAYARLQGDQRRWERPPPSLFAVE